VKRVLVTGPPDAMPAGFEAAVRHDVLDGHLQMEAIDSIVHLEVKHHVMNPDQRAVGEIDAVRVAGTRAWLDWASARNIPRFIFASSVKAVRVRSGPTLETAAPQTSDAYGRSKARAEDAVLGWAGADPQRGTVILRFAPVYGPGNTANLTDFARQALRGRRCFVGQGHTRKSVVSLRNTTASIAWGLQNSAAGCDVYNVSDRAAHSTGELATMIAPTGGAPRPRGVPMPLARLSALAGNLAGLVFGCPATLNSKRLAACWGPRFSRQKRTSHADLFIPRRRIRASRTSSPG
jgi:nucleoside-diphosphate-sugar epimerase